MSLNVTDRLSDALRTALAGAGLEAPGEVLWEVPREEAHGDYATNVAMALAKSVRRPPRQVAETIRQRFPGIPEVEKVEVAGPGFLNVFLAPAWCAEALGEILQTGDAYGRSDAGGGRRVQIEFVSANPTGPLVVVSARAAAVGDSLARILAAQGYRVFREYYVNDAGNQVQTLARSLEIRIRQQLGEAAELPGEAYPGEYLVELAKEYLAAEGPGVLKAPEAERLDRLAVFAVKRITDGQRRALSAYGVEFDNWFSERALTEGGEPARVLERLRERGFVYDAEGAAWFRSTAFGDDKDRVLVKSDGEATYFVNDIAYHVNKIGRGFERLIALYGPDHHGHVPRMKAALKALGYPEEILDVLIIQLVTLLREGQPVRMSKRMGEFVTMEELLGEVGRDAARFTFLTRRHDSPLDFDLEGVTRQTAENPVYYVQYAHARIASIFQHLREKKLPLPDWRKGNLGLLRLAEEQSLIKRLLQFPHVVAAAARTLEPHRLAYYLQELAGLFHPYYKGHRVIGDDLALTNARLALAAGVGLVVRNGLDLLGVSAPEKM
ncbi:MAG: arginine--tRNA ligase [Candidatus Rokubacteria bacterium]|nr:arginine--tRNA ligase [Candidatus Rokubacteria bacterium]